MAEKPVEHGSGVDHGHEGKKEKKEKKLGKTIKRSELNCLHNEQDLSHDCSRLDEIKEHSRFRVCPTGNEKDGCKMEELHLYINEGKSTSVIELSNLQPKQALCNWKVKVIGAELSKVPLNQQMI